MKRDIEMWMIGFVAGLVVAIVVGVGVSRVRSNESAEPGQEGRRPNPMQLRLKNKSNDLRLASAAIAVAS